MSQNPTNLVADALSLLSANGVSLRASLDSVIRLQATAENLPPKKSAPEPATMSDSDRNAEVQTSPPVAMVRSDSGLRPPTELKSNHEPGSKGARLAALRESVLPCKRCTHLANSRTQVVFGVGNPNAELMFVGEAPGADEDLVGEPFVGRAGQLLTRMIGVMNFRRQDIYIANILKCRPNMPPGQAGNRKPTPAEMEVCKPYLIQQVDIIQPKVVVALGATAVEGLLGMANAGITKLRGKWQEFHGIPMMPTFHPSFLLRPGAQQLANKRLVWEDMLAVLEKLGHEITEKQHAYFLTK